MSLNAPLLPPKSPLRAHHAHWPQRLPLSLGLPSTTLWDNLAVSAQRYPHKCAVQFMGTAWTYLELMRQAERLAAWLGLTLSPACRAVNSLKVLVFSLIRIFLISYERCCCHSMILV